MDLNEIHSEMTEEKNMLNKKEDISIKSLKEIYAENKTKIWQWKG